MIYTFVYQTSKRSNSSLNFEPEVGARREKGKVKSKRFVIIHLPRLPYLWFENPLLVKCGKRVIG